MQRGVERQPGIRAKHAVALGGKLGVVPGTEALELGPADPAGGERTLVSGSLELGCGIGHLRPGFGWFFGIQASGLERVLVVMENGCGTVEGETQHLTVRCRVIASHCRNIGIGIELDARLFHDIRHRHDCPLAGHHRRRSHLEHLQDVRRVTGAERGNGRCHGLVITALERRNNLVFFLAVVEILGEIIDPLAQCTPHGVPPLDFGLCLNLSTY